MSLKSSLSSYRAFVLIRLEREEHEPWFESVFFCLALNVAYSSWILLRLAPLLELRIIWLRSLLPPLMPCTFKWP